MTIIDDVKAVRLMIGEPVEADSSYSDNELQTRILASDSDLELVAAEVWREKAAKYANQVDITEAGSSRKNSSLYEHAREMADRYATITQKDDVGSYSTTRPIVRG